MSNYEKGTLGWLRERAKKDGFEVSEIGKIGKWNKSKRINYIVDQSWTKEKVLDLIKKTYDNESSYKIRIL